MRHFNPDQHHKIYVFVPNDVIAEFQEMFTDKSAANTMFKLLKAYVLDEQLKREFKKINEGAGSR
jgi:hypothetical protein